MSHCRTCETSREMHSCWYVICVVPQRSLRLIMFTGLLHYQHGRDESYGGLQGLQSPADILLQNLIMQKI
jgi:hypothetical protein